MLKLLLFEFDDNFEPPEYICTNRQWDECKDCPLLHYDDDFGGECGCHIANGSKQPSDEELRELGARFKCPLYDLFYE